MFSTMAHPPSEKRAEGERKDLSSLTKRYPSEERVFEKKSRISELSNEG
jgi:hypothetical protein